MVLKKERPGVPEILGTDTIAIDPEAPPESFLPWCTDGVDPPPYITLPLLFFYVNLNDMHGNDSNRHDNNINLLRNHSNINNGNHIHTHHDNVKSHQSNVSIISALNIRDMVSEGEGHSNETRSSEVRNWNKILPIEGVGPSTYVSFTMLDKDDTRRAIVKALQGRL